MPGVAEKHSTLSLQIDVVHFESEDVWVAYCPSLELSTYGEREADLRKHFDEVLEIFLADQLEKRSLARYLKKRGWKLTGRKYIPSKLAMPLDLLEQLPDYTIRNSRTFQYTISLP